MWMRATGNSWGARDLLARRAVLAFRPSDPEEWYEALLTNAQAASNDRQWTTAYAIASRVDDAYASGTGLRDPTLGDRDDSTRLFWVVGTPVYHELQRPQDGTARSRRYAWANSASCQVGKVWLITCITRG